MSDDDKVVQLRKRPPIVRAPYGKRPWCGHRYMELDISARTIECADCKALLDPYDCLNQLMHESDYTHAEKELSRLKSEIAQLEEEKKRLRATVNRAKRGAGT